MGTNRDRNLSILCLRCDYHNNLILFLKNPKNQMHPSEIDNDNICQCANTIDLIIQCQLDNTKAAKKQRIKGYGFLGEIKGRGSNIAHIYIYKMVTAGYPPQWWERTRWKLVEIEYHFDFVFCFLVFWGKGRGSSSASASALLCGLYKFEGLKLFL